MAAYALPIHELNRSIDSDTSQHTYKEKKPQPKNFTHQLKQISFQKAHQQNFSYQNEPTAFDDLYSV